MNKRIIMSVAIVASSVATVVGTSGVIHAATAGATKTHSGITRRTEGVRGEAKLNQAVRDGVITKAQKVAFENEAKLLGKERKAALSKTRTSAERQAEHKALKTELKAWAATNNFPLAKIFPKLAD